MRWALSRILDEHGVNLVGQVLADEVRFALRFECEH
jgi:hypothetical protein